MIKKVCKKMVVLREIVSRREELQTSERSESLIECFSTANNERFDQTLCTTFVGEQA